MQFGDDSLLSDQLGLMQVLHKDKVWTSSRYHCRHLAEKTRELGLGTSVFCIVSLNFLAEVFQHWSPEQHILHKGCWVGLPQLDTTVDLDHYGSAYAAAVRTKDLTETILVMPTFGRGEVEPQKCTPGTNAAKASQSQRRFRYCQGLSRVAALWLRLPAVPQLDLQFVASAKAAASPVAMLAISSALLAVGIVQVGGHCLMLDIGS